MEEDEPEEKIAAAKVEAAAISEPEEIEFEATNSSDSTTELAKILPVEQKPVLEGTTTGGFDDEAFLFDDERSEPHSSDDTSKIDEPRQLDQEADAEDDIDLLLVPEAAPEPMQSPKKLHCRRCKAVKSSLDRRYWSVSSGRRRKSSRVRRQPDFFAPS